MSVVALGPDRRRRLCVAVLGAIVAAIVILVATADGPESVSGKVGGDYPSFHAAGEIVRDDPGLDAEEFYDPARQAEAQTDYLPEDEDGQLYFAYPAFYVLPYVAISLPGYSAAYLLHTGLMAAALAVGLRLLRPCSRIARDYPLETFTAALCFYPMFRGVTGGQNTALTFLLTAVVWRSVHDDRDVPAGIALGLLLFKPPFALPFIGVFLLARKWRLLATFVVTAAGLYVLGAALTDPGWPSAWVDAIRFLDEFDTPFNVQNFVSIPGVAEAVFGIDDGVAFVVGYGAAGLVALAVAWLWMQAPRRAIPLDLLIGVTTVAAILVSPHALYYDAGLLVIAGLVLLERSWRLGPVVALLWLGGLLHLLADALEADPLILVVIAAFVLLYRGALPRTQGEPVPEVSAP